MKKSIFLLTAFLFSSLPMVFTQQYEDKVVPVSMNGELKLNGFTGGHNVPQFSEVDFNNDGIMDLYVFDREGGVSITYLQIEENGSPVYRYAPQFRRHFPDLQDWVLMRDFDNDGAADIFASSSREGVPGFRVWKGFYENDELQFDRMEFDNTLGLNILTFPVNGSDTNIEVTNIDYPALDDVDNDGDLDILTFDQGGSFIFWYRNRSVENGNGLTELDFVLEDDCWGGFKEAGLSPVITLSSIPGECAEGLPPNPGVDERHAGSTVLTFDEDGDIDREIFIGDLISPSIVGLRNAGVLDDAWMDEQDITYPSYDIAVNINFPASFYVDVDFDGAKDFIAAPNETNNSPNLEVAWFYKNTNTTEEPIFEFQQRDFLVESMIDLGENSYPAFADVTGDGLLDLVVGNVGFFLSNGNQDSYLFLFENVGTATAPEFNLVDDNWLNFNQFTSITNAFQPTFADMDGDEDLDLIVGDNSGNLFYGENTAGVGNPMEFNTIVPQWFGIAVGQRASPTVGDISGDGLPDLVLGRRNKFIHYFENIGTATEPAFNPDIAAGNNSAGFGTIDASQPEHPVTGFSTPELVPFGDTYRLFIGIQKGVIWQYDNIGGDPIGPFVRTTDSLGLFDEGRESNAAFADIDNDGFLEMVVGNRRGGLRFLDTDLDTEPVNTTENEFDFSFAIFPNPTSNRLIIDLENIVGNQISCTIYNVLGQKMEEETIRSLKSEIQVGHLASGVYFCEIKVGDRVKTKRFVKE